IIACLADTADLRLVAALAAPGHAAIGRDAGELAGIGKAGVSVGADAVAEIIRERVLIEFSVPEASLAHLRLVAQAGARAVIGTTGFSAAQRAEIAELAKRAAILLSPNMSVATNVAFKLLATMAKALGDEYDIEITETHHRFKKDAPSGTALRMAEVVAAALGRDLDQVAVYGRQGLPGERSRPEIGILSLRTRAEQVVGAWFSVDVEMAVDLSSAVVSDQVSTTIDYGVVARRIVEIGTKNRVNLIERLAGLIVEALLREFPAREIRVRVRKLT